jgi:AcrR family transcriptional regulator
MVRTGRRPGESGTRDAILNAARESFAAQGYDGATIRGIGRAAGVDPALVHHYFGSKDALFAAAMQLPVDASAVLPDLLAPGLDGMGERLVRFFLSLWESGRTRAAMLAVFRSALVQDRAATALREFIGREVLGRVGSQVPGPDAQLRASLVGSQLVGLAIARYVLRVEPLASAEPETVVAAVAPTLQRYLAHEGLLTGTSHHA